MLPERFPGLYYPEKAASAAEGGTALKETYMSQQAQAAGAGLQKQAETEKEAADRFNAYGYGIDAYLEANDIDKTKFANALGVADPNLLPEAALEWTAQQMAEPAAA
jgi:hypothetical protein